jgi:hypothetical protein
MKVFALAVVGVGMFLAGRMVSSPKVQRNGKEWNMRVRVPKCPSVQNLQVVFPSDISGQVEIECDVVEVSK